MADFTPKTHDEILTDEILWATAHSTKISDFNDGSINKAILSAVAIVIEEAYYDIMLGWKASLRYALQRSLGFERLGGAKSAGNQTFSRSTPAPADVPIDIGTITATEDGVRFVTIEDGAILSGNTDSAPIAVNAEEVGSNGNVSAGTINTLVSTPSGVETVSNASATVGGVNAESDNDYDARFALYIQGLTRSSIVGLESGALGVVGVSEAKIYEVSSGNLILFVNDGSGVASVSLITDVATVMEGDGSTENPGYRPAGIFISYQSSAKVLINVTATIYHDNTVESTEIEASVTEAITEYINGLKIGEDVVISGIIASAKGVAGVKDFTISAPATNVVTDISAGEVAKYGSGTYSTAIYVDLP